jgi:hypothetical protein
VPDRSIGSAAQAPTSPRPSEGDRAIGTVPPQTNTRPARGALELSAPETARDISIFNVAAQPDHRQGVKRRGVFDALAPAWHGEAQATGMTLPDPAMSGRLQGVRASPGRPRQTKDDQR